MFNSSIPFLAIPNFSYLSILVCLSFPNPVFSQEIHDIKEMNTQHNNFFLKSIISSSQDTPSPKGVGGGTRDGCLIVPLIPSGKSESKTSLARPVVWFYVEYPKTESIPQVEISHKDVNGKSISRFLELDNLNPTFVSYTLPIGKQKLNENQTFQFKVNCNGDGNPIGINIKRISARELGAFSITAIPSLQYITNLYKLGFWAESTNLILVNSRNLLCKDKANIVDLFALKVDELFSKLNADQAIKDNMRVAFQKHFDKACK